MIYFYFSGRQTGKTTKAIEIFNRDIDNILMVHDSSTKQHLKGKILREALIDPKHNYLLDRKIKSIKESLVGYRCKTLIIDEPLDSNLDITGDFFLNKITSLLHTVEKDIIILQSIENPKTIEYIEISNKVYELYKIKYNNKLTTTTQFEKDITKIVEEIYHKATMINVLSEEIENELDNFEEFTKEILRIINILPLQYKCKIITNKLPE